MDINFNLNERQNSDQLSDRIINSANDVFKGLLCGDSVQKFLLNGEMTDENLAIAHRRHKNAIQTMDDTFAVEVFRKASTLSDDTKEKQFFELCIQSYKEIAIKYCNEFEELFGKLDPNLMDAPMTQWLYSYKIFSLYTASKGSVLRVLVTIFGMYMVCDRVLDYLKQNPNFTPNIFAKMLLYEDFSFKPMYETIRQMIDCRADQVSEAEERELSELFRRTVAYERLIAEQEYMGGQGFNQ